MPIMGWLPYDPLPAELFFKQERVAQELSIGRTELNEIAASFFISDC